MSNRDAFKKLEQHVNKKSSLSIPLTIGKTKKLPRITEDTFNKFIKSLPSRDPRDTANRVNDENPAIFGYVQLLQDRISKVCADNAAGKGRGAKDAGGKKIKAAAIAESDCKQMVAEIALAVYELLSIQLYEDTNLQAPIVPQSRIILPGSN